jgi:hypothetical protein
MKKIKYILGLSSLLALFLVGCQQETYTLGDLNAPSSLVINTQVIGQSVTNPNGDGSGNVKITLTANNALTYKIGYKLINDNNSPILTQVPTGSVTKKFEDAGVSTYRITAVAYGKGGTSTNITKDITVRVDFNMDPTIISNITNNSSKTWVVDKSVASHLRVAPWSDNDGAGNPNNPATVWWSASINEKEVCCNCFYTARYTFTKTPTNTYTLAVASPDGIFMNKADNNLGVTGTTEECTPFTQPTKGFSFGSATSRPLPNDVPATTGFRITVDGVDGFIGYGSAGNTYEILESTPTFLYLRARGANQSNLWYIKLKAI